jgi:hypothetical protein
MVLLFKVLDTIFASIAKAADTFLSMLRNYKDPWFY